MFYILLKINELILMQWIDKTDINLLNLQIRQYKIILDNIGNI